MKRDPSAVLLFLLLAAVPAAAQKADAEATFNAGLTHLRENRPQLALDQFKKAVKDDPKNPYFYKGLGLAHARLNQFPEAVAALRKAIELNPYYVDVRNDLGTVLVLSGRREEGKAEFVAAFNDATNPTPEISARNLGQAYFEEKNYDLAANWFRTSIARRKENPDAVLGLAEALLALGRPEDAAGVLEQGLKDVPNHTGIMVLLGDAYYRGGKFTEARVKLEEVARRDPMGAPGRRAAELLKHLPR
ncbi:MAG TPA: tetratricopeptide repeat protein [Vicinamibacteria bacterium]